jgi:hypothetical protein
MRGHMNIKLFIRELWHGCRLQTGTAIRATSVKIFREKKIRLIEGWLSLIQNIFKQALPTEEEEILFCKINK